MKRPSWTLKPDTVIAHVGRDPEANHGVVNPPVYHASTVLFPTVADLERRKATPYDGTYYGSYGTPTSFAFEEAVAALDGADRAVQVGCGHAAISTALLAFLASGDHVLMTDSTYGPTRTICDAFLKPLGIETTYYDPLLGAGIAGLIRPNTKIVYLESPGSLTFEVQDVPAIAAAAHARGAKVMLDNTWASGLFFKPYRHGVDVAIYAATKYIGGHSDAMLGVVTMREADYEPIKRTASVLGMTGGPDDVYLCLRGLRTIGVRMRRHQESGLAVARWLAARPEVARVLHPALAGDPGHAIWKRDFEGAAGLFAIVLKDAPKAAADAFLDALELFAIGYSWGGFESLVVPADIASARTAAPRLEGPLVRLHIGLEDTDDLIRDLEQGLARMRDAR